MVAATAVGGGKYKKAPQKQTEIVTVPQLTPIKLGFSKKREIKHSMLSPWRSMNTAPTRISSKTSIGEPPKLAVLSISGGKPP
jgi:hypothetical protein